MIRTCSLNKLKELKQDSNTYNFFIVRHSDINNSNLIHLPVLSPSPELLHWYKSQDPDDGWVAFEKAFVSELSSPEANAALQYIISLDALGKNVNLVCYCNESQHCHRTIVAEMLTVRGATVDKK